MSLRVSQLLDGQLDLEATRETLRDLARAPHERDRLTLYGIVGDTLRRNPTPDDGFTLRILARLEGERIDPAYDPLAEPPQS